MQINKNVTGFETLKEMGRRFWFVLLLTAVAVFFSEKAYWYPQGFDLVELLFFYGVPAYVCLWLIEQFNINSFPTVILLAGLYAFLIEGVLTPVIFEAGLFDPVIPAYFIGWHGLFSILFGWYFVRKWLVEGRWGRLLMGSTVFGLWWGLWSITYWLPVQAEDFPDAIGPFGTVGTFWTVTEFGLYAFTFTGILMLSHLLLGWGGWLAQFRLTKVEKGVLLGLMLFFFVTLSVPGAPLGFIKLGVLITAVIIPLKRHRQQKPTDSLLKQLAQRIHRRLLIILPVMPTVATAVYALAAPMQSDFETLLLINEVMAFVQVVLGGGLFVWAWIKCIRFHGFCAQMAAL